MANNTPKKKKKESSSSLFAFFFFAPASSKKEKKVSAVVRPNFVVVAGGLVHKTRPVDLGLAGPLDGASHSHGFHAQQKPVPWGGETR